MLMMLPIRNAALTAAAAFALVPAIASAQRAEPARATGLAVGDSDYPLTAMMAREEGKVEAVVQLDEQARVTACDVLTSSGSAALDEGGCKLARRRGNFVAARDERGQPVPGALALNFWWVLKSFGPGLIGTITDSARRSADGQVNGCRREVTGQYTMWMKPDDACFRWTVPSDNIDYATIMARLHPTGALTMTSRVTSGAVNWETITPEIVGPLGVLTIEDTATRRCWEVVRGLTKVGYDPGRCRLVETLDRIPRGVRRTAFATLTTLSFEEEP